MNPPGHWETDAASAVLGGILQLQLLAGCRLVLALLTADPLPVWSSVPGGSVEV